MKFYSFLIENRMFFKKNRHSKLMVNIENIVFTVKLSLRTIRTIRTIQKHYNNLCVS